MRTCGRCGSNAHDLKVFRPGGNAARQRLCTPCYEFSRAHLKPRGKSFHEEHDNAWWDRIYREKFENPDYYADRLPVNLQSSLGGLPADYGVPLHR